MKKLAIISITLVILSGSVFATAAEQRSTASSAVEKAPIISFSMIKAAFKFGFQSGWMIKK